MREVKNKNFSFRAVAFSSKLFSVIAATMLLLLVDGAIHDAPAPVEKSLTDINNLSKGKNSNNRNNLNSQNASIQQTQQYPVTLESHHQRLQALSDKAGLKMNPNAFATSLESHRERLYYLEVMAGITTTNDPYEYNSLESQHQRLEALEQAFANNPPATQQTSVQQDITSTGNSATQTPLPQSVCNMMINGQCNPNTVTAVTAVVGVAVIGGITAAVVSAVNNQAQQAQQEQNSKNLWAIVAATAKGAASGGPSCQCNSAIQTSPPYCTGAGICQCGAPNCPP